MAIAPYLQEPRWLDVEVFTSGYLTNATPGLQRSPHTIPMVLATAEEFVEGYCRRQFYPEPVAPTGVGTPVTKTFRLRPTKSRLRIPDLRAASQVLVDGAALLPSGPSFSGTGYGYETDEQDGWPAKSVVIRYYAVGRWVRTIQVTGWWGWYPIPAAVADAAYRIAARLYHERAAAYSDAVVSPDGGVLQYFRQLPGSVQASLNRYQDVLVGSATLGGL